MEGRRDWRRGGAVRGDVRCSFSSRAVRDCVKLS